MTRKAMARELVKLIGEAEDKTPYPSPTPEQLEKVIEEFLETRELVALVSPPRLHRSPDSIFSDLEECREWIEILEFLSWRCERSGMKNEEAACTTLLVALYKQRKDALNCV